MEMINEVKYYGIREIAEEINKFSGLEISGQKINKILLEEGYISFFNGKNPDDGYLPSNKFYNYEFNCEYRLWGKKRGGYMVLKFNDKGLIKIVNLLNQALVK